MRHSGALRIDHVMGLYRLFWVPLGGNPADGAYVRYPFYDLLGLLALESHRNQCMVVGEDLGTVLDEVRAALAPLGVLSYRLLLFERNAAGDFKPPAEYPRNSLAAASTHDLPTLAGFWEGRDILMRAEHRLLPSDALRDEQIVERARDRAKLLLALEREQLLPPGATANPVSVSEMSPAFVRVVNEYLARSPAKLLVVQLEDVTGMREQMNLPGTTTEALVAEPDDDVPADWEADVAAWRRPGRDDVYLLVYTSGTTGTPKGVMLAHGNTVAGIDGFHHIIPDIEYRIVSLLPMSHLFEQG